MAANIVKFLRYFGLEKSTIDLLFNIGDAVLILIFGWIAISMILRIEKKALAKSRLYEALQLFIVKASKLILLFVLMITLLSTL